MSVSASSLTPPPERASPLQAHLQQLHAALHADATGEVATYIPELGRADPMRFGIALAMVDGHIHEVGDTRDSFTIQSISKPFTYGRALYQHGRDRVLQHVGVEPTGEAFNAIILDEPQNRPFNPMVNAGAIAIADLAPGETPQAREDGMLALFSALAGRSVGIDRAVYESERSTGHRNRAIAWLMLNSGMIRSDPEAVLDLYFKQCSVLVSCRDMAVMAATLANHGRNPLTGVQVFPPDVVRDVLTLMSTCGMYNYAGEWAYEVGIPAKSGVSGGIIAVIPGQAGIAVWSPPLDRHGNSIRGVRVCQDISRAFSLHVHSDRTNVGAVIRSQYRGDAVGSQRVRSTPERRHLQAHGGEIGVIEAQGALYFGSAELLSRRLAQLAQGSPMLILDLRRVTNADAAADRLIAQTARHLLAQGIALAVTGLAPDGALGGLRAVLAGDAGLSRMLFFDDCDAALEHFEEALLARAALAPRPEKLDLREMELFAGLQEDDLRLLQGIAASFQYEAGQSILCEGDEARAFFIVARGSASIFINLGSGARKRVGSVGPGLSFGEMALLDGGRRSADVVADTRMICYAFSVDRIRELAQDRPRILATIMGNLVRNLSDRLRQANAQLRALE